MRKNQRKKGIAFLGVLAVLLVAGCIWYVQDYYRSDGTVQQYFHESGQVKIDEIEHGLFLDGPGNDNAFIFYPGAKVEYTAYVPLLYQIAENGTDVFLIKMPCNLAFLGKDRAEDIIKKYGYDNWYLGGHSLGGAMAASFAAEHLNILDGLALLAAYSTKSLQAEGFSVLSIYGSEDGVLNMDKVQEGRKDMPSEYTEICIKGGNHAQFGNYGKQKKDGAATVSSEEQQKQTIEAICNMIDKHET